MATRHSGHPSLLRKGTVDKVLQTAVGFLQDSQLPHGEFKTQASKNAAMTKACVFDSSPFTTAYVLYSLGFQQDIRTETMTAKGLKFLQAEMEDGGVWRYWSSRNVAHRVLPPDLDDTACISFLLQQYNLAPANHGLLLANRTGDGLFYTWLAPRDEMPAPLKTVIRRLTRGSSLPLFSISGTLHNVDPAVNANVLLYLGEQDETRSVVSYLIKSTKDANLQKGSYYADPLVFYYLISRAFYHGVTPLADTCPTILNALQAHRKSNGSFGNELLTALAVCTWFNFKGDRDSLTDSIIYLLRTRRRSGAWRAVPMWLGPAPYYGSEELTTALCIEALARYIS
jgi:hypothetical protein